MRNVVGYDGLYSIDEDGRVWSHTTNKFISVVKNKRHNGYVEVTLWKNNKRKTFRLHRLVAIAFIPNPNNLPEVNHKNGDKSDNRVSNLEWVSPSENVKHAYSTGLKEPMSCDKNGMHKLKWGEVTRIRELYKTGEFGYGRLAKMFNVSKSNISFIVNNVTWKEET